MEGNVLAGCDDLKDVPSGEGFQKCTKVEELQIDEFQCM